MRTSGSFRAGLMDGSSGSELRSPSASSKFPRRLIEVDVALFEGLLLGFGSLSRDQLGNVGEFEILV